MEFNRYQQYPINFNDSTTPTQFKNLIITCNNKFTDLKKNKYVELLYINLKEKIFILYNILNVELANNMKYEINQIDEIYEELLDEFEYFTEKINQLSKSILKIFFIREINNLHKFCYIMYGIICYRIKKITGQIGKYYNADDEKNI